MDLGDFNPVRVLAGKGEIGKSGLGPALATLALDYFVPGLGEAAGLGMGNAATAATLVGGTTALASGSLQKGLMAGLSAYGTEEMLGGAQKGIEQAATDKIEQTMDLSAKLSPMEKLTSGLQGIKGMPTMDLLKYGAMAAAPVLTAQGQKGLPSNPTNPNAYIRPKAYDPVSHRYYDLPAVKADDWGSQSIADYVNSQVAPARAARGGLMAAYADGGMTGYATGGGDGAGNPSPTDGSNAQLAFENEPAIRMARGGRIEDGTRRFDIGGEAAAQLASAYQGGANDLQAMVNTLGVTQADVNKYFPGFDVAGAGLTLPGQTGGGGASAASTPAAAAATPQYASYTPEQYAAFFANPANASVLNTPGGLTAAETQFRADPAAVMAYLQGAGTKSLGLSAADLNALGTNQGLQGIYAAGDQWIAAHPNATGAEIQSVLKDAGWSDKDVTNYFNRPNAAYGTNLATGQAFTGAQDLNTILGNKQGFSDMNTAINSWIATHLPTTTSLSQAQAAMSAAGLNEQDVIRATGKTSAQIYAEVKKQQQDKTGTTTGTGTGLSGVAPASITTTTLPTNWQTNAPAGTQAPYGNINNPGDIIINPDGSKTIVPNIPGRPRGAFSGAGEVTNAWTAGGGHLGQVLAPTRTYGNTGTSADVYNYLGGTGKWSDINPQPAPKPKNTYSNFSSPSTSEKTQFSKYKKVWKDGALVDNPYYGVTDSTTDTSKTSTATTQTSTTTQSTGDANGGEIHAAMARGGMADGHLGGYSDGGRLLRGPGDGVSDSIPATIGNKQPARLADGEFVVPARIVSEIGNGSTEAGARKLYAMMDRVQKARGKTVGKGKVAKNTRADKYLPA